MLGFAWRMAKRENVYNDSKYETILDVHCEALVRVGWLLQPQPSAFPGLVWKGARQDVQDATKFIRQLAGDQGEN